MSDYPKKIHECFKRTLIFTSGNKIKPVAFCFVNGFFQDSPCSGTVPANEDDQRENRELYRYFPNESRCSSCPFLKCGEYVSDALRSLKSFGVFCAQDDTDIGESRKRYFWNTCIDNFFSQLLDKVKNRCYLTFTEEDKRWVLNTLHGMSFEELVGLVDKMENFCKENNIK